MPWGIKELKFFFSKGIYSKTGEISSNNVKEQIEKLINQENKLDPLDDSKITELLNIGYFDLPPTFTMIVLLFKMAKGHRESRIFLIWIWKHTRTLSKKMEKRTK